VDFIGVFALLLLFIECIIESASMRNASFATEDEGRSMLVNISGSEQAFAKIEIASMACSKSACW
jgi:hypothetical protein